MSRSLASQLRSQERLFRAWLAVRASCLDSDSSWIKQEALEFESTVSTGIGRIYRELKSGRFHFRPGRGWLKSRSGKSCPRPMVVQNVSERIVQKALLDLVWEQGNVRDRVDHPGSYGGIKKKGVRDALFALSYALRRGAKYYVKTDIKDFFTRIPRRLAISEMCRLLPDDSLTQILDAATVVSLANIEKIAKEYRNLFPGDEIGVAQGFCLSPLLCNVLLSEFDRTVSGEGAVSIRYIDDFIILGKSKQAAHAAFERGLSILEKHKLDTYRPGDAGDKAREGKTDKNIRFLGCKISPDFIVPERERRRSFTLSIQKRILTSVQQMKSINGDQLWNPDNSLVGTLADVAHRLRAWGGTYSFCNSTQAFEHVDNDVDESIKQLLRAYDAVRKGFDDANSRRLLGIPEIAQMKSEPILPIDIDAADEKYTDKVVPFIDQCLAE